MNNFNTPTPIDYIDAHDYAAVTVGVMPKASAKTIADNVKNVLKTIVCTNRFTVGGMEDLVREIRNAMVEFCDDYDNANEAFLKEVGKSRHFDNATACNALPRTKSLRFDRNNKFYDTFFNRVEK